MRLKWTRNHDRAQFCIGGDRWCEKSHTCCPRVSRKPLLGQTPLPVASLWEFTSVQSPSLIWNTHSHTSTDVRARRTSIGCRHAHGARCARQLLRLPRSGFHSKSGDARGGRGPVGRYQERRWQTCKLLFQGDNFCCCCLGAIFLSVQQPRI